MMIHFNLTAVVAHFTWKLLIFFLSFISHPYLSYLKMLLIFSLPLVLCLHPHDISHFLVPGNGRAKQSFFLVCIPRVLLSYSSSQTIQSDSSRQTHSVYHHPVYHNLFLPSFRVLLLWVLVFSQQDLRRVVDTLPHLIASFSSSSFLILLTIIFSWVMIPCLDQGW